MHPLDSLLRVILPAAALAVLTTVAVVGWTTEPNRIEVGFAPQQPLPFSHKLHAGDNKIDCRYCHTGPGDSRLASLPTVETCMNCHRVTKPGTDLIRQLSGIYADGQALKWKRVYSLPDYVYFDHRPHVNAGMECAVCHGEVAKMEVMRQEMPLRMGNCLNCHRGVHDYITNPAYKADLDPKLKGAENCDACHR
jgi:hypothetical protein